MVSMMVITVPGIVTMVGVDEMAVEIGRRMAPLGRVAVDELVTASMLSVSLVLWDVVDVNRDVVDVDRDVVELDDAVGLLGTGTGTPTTLSFVARAIRGFGEGWSRSGCRPRMMASLSESGMAFWA